MTRKTVDFCDKCGDLIIDGYKYELKFYPAGGSIIKRDLDLKCFEVIMDKLQPDRKD